MNRIDISCVCVTHGRPYLVEEALESFRRQTMKDNVELLIVNDCPEHQLRCRLPGVRIINLRHPITDLAAKFNWAVKEAAGEWVAWWEDDDISLPHRLEYSASMASMHNVDYWKQCKAWNWNHGRIDSLGHNLYFGNSFFKRDLYLNSGGATPGGWADATAHDNMRETARTRFAEEDPNLDDVYWVYCWGGRCFHDSGGGEQDSLTRFRRFRTATLNDPRFTAGIVELEPRWQQDYCKLVNEAVAAGIGHHQV